MKLEKGEVLLFEEDIHPEVRAEVEGNIKEIEDIKEKAQLLVAELDLLKSKMDYLSKKNWAAFDKRHPKTSPRLHEYTEEKGYCRRFDLDENKVGVVEYNRSAGANNAVSALKEFLTTLTEKGADKIKVEVFRGEDA